MSLKQNDDSLVEVVDAIDRLANAAEQIAHELRMLRAGRGDETTADLIADRDNLRALLDEAVVQLRELRNNKESQ